MISRNRFRRHLISFFSLHSGMGTTVYHNVWSQNDSLCIILYVGSGEETDFESNKSTNGTDEEENKEIIIEEENGFTNSSLLPLQLRLHQDFLVPHELEVRGAGIGGVWSKTSIPRGTKYGPYCGKWLQKPYNTEFAWEVSDIL